MHFAAVLLHGGRRDGPHHVHVLLQQCAKRVDADVAQRSLSEHPADVDAVDYAENRCVRTLISAVRTLWSSALLALTFDVPQLIVEFGGSKTKRVLKQTVVNCVTQPLDCGRHSDCRHLTIGFIGKSISVKLQRTGRGKDAGQ